MGWRRCRRRSAGHRWLWALTSIGWRSIYRPNQNPPPWKNYHNKFIFNLPPWKNYHIKSILEIPPWKILQNNKKDLLPETARSVPTTAYPVHGLSRPGGIPVLIWDMIWIGVPPQWRIQDFPDMGGGGRQLPRWGSNLLFVQIFTQNCMKMKKFGPREGACPWRNP